LSALLETGNYNCISSAILYLILARDFGLEARGVLLSSHIFVQVNLAGGKALEIETTSATGYDWVHDERFYEEKAENWSRTRGFAPATYQEYLKRSIVSPYEVILHNLTNQHTGRGKIKSSDKNRLEEARGYLDAEDKPAQAARLNVYQREFSARKKKNDFSSLVRMFQIVSPIFQALESRWPQDKEILNLLAWMRYEYGYSLQMTGKSGAALPWVESSLATLQEDFEDYAALLGNNLILLDKYIEGLAAGGRFEEGALLYQAHQRECEKVEWCPRKVRSFYGDWASYYWNSKEWEKAIAKFSEELSLEKKPDGRERILKNIAGAYYNWATEKMKSGDWPAALKIYGKCLEEFPTLSRCKNERDELKERHRLK
jgi:tetratricopeptide (TPR) repeat protein